MRQRSLVFDASALVCSKPILSSIQNDYSIKVTELISKEAGISKGVDILELTDDDIKLAFRILRQGFGKEQAKSYLKHRKMKQAGEAEALAIAKRLNLPVVLQESLACSWCKMYQIRYIEIVNLPEKVSFIPINDQILFYEALCKQRSYLPKSCEKAKELNLKKTKVL